jgi:hypothetical protein
MKCSVLTFVIVICYSFKRYDFTVGTRQSSKTAPLAVNVQRLVRCCFYVGLGMLAEKMGFTDFHKFESWAACHKS